MIIRRQTQVQSKLMDTKIDQDRIQAVHEFGGTKVAIAEVFYDESSRFAPLIEWGDNEPELADMNRNFLVSPESPSAHKCSDDLSGHYSNKTRLLVAA